MSTRILDFDHLEQKFGKNNAFCNDLEKNQSLELAVDMINRLTKVFRQTFIDSNEKSEDDLTANWFFPNQQLLIKNLLILCPKAKQMFAEEDRVIRVSSPCYILGHIHGNLFDLMRFSRVL